MGKLTNLNPPTPIAETDLPAVITRDAELTAAVNALVSDIALNYLKKSVAHNITPNPDTYSTTLISNDANLDGIIKGWHIYTSLRGNDPTFGTQIAVCDTQNGLKFRRKTAGVWHPWVTIV